MIQLRLFWEFFKIGLFAVGGGMATLPFLKTLSENTGWYSMSFITDMIAISESTPGPIGINMATYVGYNVAGFLGGIIATAGVTIPSIIIVTFVAKNLEKFKDNPLISCAFYGLRPAVTGLIAAAGMDVMMTSFLFIKEAVAKNDMTILVNPLKLLTFIVFLWSICKYKKHPVLYIAIGAATGLVLHF